MMGVWELLVEHPDEVVPLLRARYAAYKATQLPRDSNLAFCYEILNRVSRSFAIVIQQLGPELRDAVCIFYLALRALDTVEDDMHVPVSKKVPVLREFHGHLREESWRFPCGSKDYKRLMDNFDHLSRAFQQLDLRFQQVIEDVAKEMGAGMAKFIETEVATCAQYDEYCGYVAGLVGVGLSRMFAAGAAEARPPEALSNAMGLFLQKTNIVRDYLEDVLEEPAPRMFWPREIWGLYAPQLSDFKYAAEESSAAVLCLNHMVTDALQHAPHCLEYLAGLRNERVFRFCAIPQVMAMATLATCYGNVRVFQGVVKLRRGLTAKLMDGTHDVADVRAAFHHFASELALKVNPRDPNAELTLQRVRAIQQSCLAAGPLREKFGKDRSRRAPLLVLVLLALLAFTILQSIGVKAFGSVLRTN